MTIWRTLEETGRASGSTLRTRWTMSAAAVLLGLQFLAAAPAQARAIADPDPTEDGGAGGSSGKGYVFPPNGFSWEAANRFSLSAGAWQSREETEAWKPETYRPGYVNPTSWRISVMGCQTQNDYLQNVDPEGYKQLQEEEPDKYPDQTNLYRWQWNGYTASFSKSCNGALTFPSEGIYYVTLTVRRADGSEQSWTNTVEVKDFLVVVLGDSSASGEGAPDSPLSETSDARAEWMDNRCHRSMKSGSAQAAKRIEDGDSHTSVTFISFACSGATLATDIYDGSILDPYEDEEDYDHRGVGVTGPYAGIEPTTFIGSDEADFRDKVPSQVDQLWNALTDFGAHQPRKIDALIVAGGINDARFADLAAVCVLNWGCHLDAQLVGEYDGTLRSLNDQFHADLLRIPAGWELLRDQLATPRPLKDGTMSQPIEASNKLALSYPPFFRDDEGDQCISVLWDSVPDWAIAIYVLFAGFPFNLVPPMWATDEVNHAESVWAPHLNAAVADGANRAGFTFVDTIPNRFDRHGICADDAYINSPTVAAETQGDEVGEAGALAQLFSKGTAHPNAKGYGAYADEILRHLNSLTKKIGGNLPPTAVADKVSGARRQPIHFNVLENDFDEDEADVLAARVAIEPQHGKVTMQLDGTTVYKPELGYIGEDQFFYEVTDGTTSRFAVVEITVRELWYERVTVTLGESLELDTLGGRIGLQPPYRMVFDQPLLPEYGTFNFEPDDGILYYDPPVLKRRRVRLDYRMYSDADGDSIRGRLVLRLKRPRL